jgi:hypothetical protein
MKKGLEKTPNLKRITSSAAGLIPQQVAPQQCLLPLQTGITKLNTRYY